MRCPDCDFELNAGQEECPRCRFREAMKSMPPTQAAALVLEEAARLRPEASEAAPLPALSPAPTPSANALERLPPGRFALFATLLLMLVVLCGVYVHSRVPVRDPTEAKIAAIFASADGPCRQGVAQPCFDSISRIRRLRDLPDASLLLGDYKVARYLRTVAGGDALAARWQQNTITGPELLAMGDQAYAKNLTVCRSFWMYAQVKRDHVAVPQFIIGGAGP